MDIQASRPDLVLCGVVQGKAAQAGGAGVADAVLGACTPVILRQLGQRELGRGDAAAVVVKAQG
ncbi:hypothetical protein [Streptomyces sp. NPDC020880]|uniref:hypothetical protein n=1 Tax=Streptomyces sp. NPDC020880 TaxID=3365098 RepID=UPI00384D690C